MSPQKTVVVKLLDDQGAERASTELTITIQNTTSTTLFDIRSPMCTNCHFTVSGQLLDLADTTFHPGVPGKTITFSGNGVPATLNSVQTGGVKFIAGGTSNVNVMDSAVRLPVGSTISLPWPATHGASWFFTGASGGDVVISLTLGNGTVIVLGDEPDELPPPGIVTNAQFPDGDGEGLKQIAITSVGGSHGSGFVRSWKSRNI